MSEGIASELDGIDLGDTRLNVRSKIILEALISNTEGSINAVCDGWKKTKAAYRFFDNDKVTPEDLMEPHREATLRRIQSQPVVLLIQDTTELDYSAHAPEGVGCLNTEQRCGFYAHVNLAATPDRLSLGVVDHELYSRTPESLGKRRERRALSIDEKESWRWLEGYEEACRVADQCPNTQVVCVADRESDIFELFVLADPTRPDRAHYLVRADGDRNTPNRDPDSGPYTFIKMADEVASSPVRAIHTIDLAETPQRAARQATVEIRAIQVTIKPPHGRSSLGVRQQNAVLVQEINGPTDKSALSWLLVTSLPINTLEEVFTTVKYYAARWTIEMSQADYPPSAALYQLAA